MIQFDRLSGPYTPLVIHWFRRDLRLTDNVALTKALTSGFKVLPIFIFDSEILHLLEPEDNRVSFIYTALLRINEQLSLSGSGIQIFHGEPVEIFRTLSEQYPIEKVFFNHDYEPYARSRDESVQSVLNEKGIEVISCKDQVIFEKGEILTNEGQPFTVFTPYSRKWKEAYRNLEPWNENPLQDHLMSGFLKTGSIKIPPLADFGFSEVNGSFQEPELDLQMLDTYHLKRDFPALDHTSHLSVHLRFGTISIREIAKKAAHRNESFLNELIWREFFMQILWHFPRITSEPFKKIYEKLEWRNNEDEFHRWCQGETGYPMVDAGMRELAQTGYMHNRVRMITASFLVKHLLIDWRWGEQWFAAKLLDYELSSNNGNWQWAAGTGCDAAPYFRIFNPLAQAEKFDPDQVYMKRWIPEYGTSAYPKPIVDHVVARNRCLEAYGKVKK